MAEETRRLIVTQPEDVAFALSGSETDPPLRHRLGGGVTLGTETPIVHMHLWDEDLVVKHHGEVVLRGDCEAPVVLEHRFPDVHHQSHVVRTGLAEPIHHALQMRTPLQVRFCNSWHVASDYTIGVELAGRTLMGIRITGATVATPQPCPEDGCPPAPPPVHP
ncbi:MAG: hypothetical protein JWO25_2555 [Alphaproteobacteria bacterium]|nr:hypothetical protein [Alphaproteobacteria bacterium]MDB5722903.1 hypothetical protein [Alphaproteobacteria bacterium]